MDAAEGTEQCPDGPQFPASSCLSMKNEGSMKVRHDLTREVADRYSIYSLFYVCRCDSYVVVGMLICHHDLTIAPKTDAETYSLIRIKATYCDLFNLSHQLSYC